MKRFEARLSPFLRGVTVIIACIFGGLAAYGLYLGNTVTAAALLGLLFLLSLFSVRGYAVHGDLLLVRRPGWTTKISLDDLVEARIDPGILRRSISVWSTRGLFGVAGYVYKRGHGFFRAYVTDPRKAVVLRFKPGNVVVVSPHSPEEFLRAVGVDSVPA